MRPLALLFHKINLITHLNLPPTSKMAALLLLNRQARRKFRREHVLSTFRDRTGPVDYLRRHTPYDPSFGTVYLSRGRGGGPGEAPVEIRQDKAKFVFQQRISA